MQSKHNSAWGWSNISQQQLKHWKQARAVHSCFEAMAHWSFIWSHAMKHLQQNRSRNMVQQDEAACIIFPVWSLNFSLLIPGGRFLAVAVKLPNPTFRFIQYVFLWFFDLYFCNIYIAREIKEAHYFCFFSSLFDVRFLKNCYCIKSTLSIPKKGKMPKDKEI